MLATVVDISGPSLRHQLDAALVGAFLALQPIVRADGSGYGHEALLRTRSEHLPSPLAVLDAARRLDRLDHVGRRARRLAAAAARPGTDLYVNLLATDLEDPDLGSEDCPLRAVASQVVLEITEHVPLDAIGGLPAKLARLRALGFRFALDDFGSGYAHASWDRLEPEVVKVDGQVVRRAVECRLSRRILTGALARAHREGALVVAEGIETEAQRTVAIGEGCDLLQGYLLGRPAPV